LGHPSEAEIGLIYMRARYYDPVAGRFISEDPAQHGTNWLTYASGNPTNKVDANGKETLNPLTMDWQKIKEGWEFIEAGVKLMRFSCRDFGKQIIADLRSRKYGPFSGVMDAANAGYSLAGLAALRQGITMVLWGTLLIMDGLGLIEASPPSPPTLPL
jgi:RHS repeat-associated protein